MSKTSLHQFDYKKVAALDAAMWRSYYNHRFFKLFWQLVQLIKQQLGFGWFLSIRLAYYAGWAAADYRIHKKKGVDHGRVLKNLINFYKLIAMHSDASFDYEKAARLELAWWEVHRKSYTNNPALERSLAEGAAVIYGVSPKQLADYAHYRAEAMILPRHEGDHQVVPVDWQKIQQLLVKAWQSLYVAVQKK